MTPRYGYPFAISKVIAPGAFNSVQIFAIRNGNLLRIAVIQMSDSPSELVSSGATGIHMYFDAIEHKNVSIQRLLFCSERTQKTELTIEQRKSRLIF